MVKKGQLITLTDFEERIAMQLAKRRNNSNTNVTQNKRVDTNRSDYEIDLEGVGAELAACRLFNVYPDFSTNNRSGGYDCILNNMRIDIKANSYGDRAHLLNPPHKTADDVDVYILMIGKFPEYKFGGWLTSSELMKEENIKDFGHSVKPYAVHHSKTHQSLQENNMKQVNLLKD